MELLIIVSLYFFISHIIEMRGEGKNPYREQEQSIEDAWRATDMTTVPADMLLAYRKYLKSKPWHTLRRIALKRDNHRCTRCGYIGNLQVHHTSYSGIYEDFNFSIDQLESVCDLCHTDIHLGLLPMSKSL